MLAYPVEKINKTIETINKRVAMILIDKGMHKKKKKNIVGIICVS